MNFIPFDKIVEIVCSKLLDKPENMIKEANVTLQTLQKTSTLLAAKARDVEEQIKNAELSGNRKRKREVANWLTEVKEIETEFRELESEVESEGFIKRFLGGGQAIKLKEIVDALVEQSRHFGELLLDVYGIRGEALLTTEPAGEAFKENSARIWRLLETNEVARIAIYGMGGVGKTTLAKHIYNELLEKTCVFWVTVSQVSAIKKLQDEIAHVAGVDLSDEKNEHRRAARLYGALSLQKNSILILDDVWKNINLEKVGYPHFVEGRKLIITTRSLDVCYQIGCKEETMVPVKTLHMNEAWELFSETLGKETKLTPQVEEIAKSMATLCDGLPLGIITMARSMRGRTAIRVWRNALEELKVSVLGQDDMEDQVFKVLKRSFDRLNPNHKRAGRSINGHSTLQLCFLCCSVYPKGRKIQKEELVRKFISEKLMDERDSETARDDLGHSILDKLVNVCLLESPEDEWVKMHDLVRAMALKIPDHKAKEKEKETHIPSPSQNKECGTSHGYAKERKQKEKHVPSPSPSEKCCTSPGYAKKRKNGGNH